MLLPYTELWATYSVRVGFRNPFHGGSLWRGVLGRALRQQGCARRAEAQEEACRGDCRQPGRCFYSLAFETPMPEPVPHRLLRGHKQAPPPLIPLLRGWRGPDAAGKALESGQSMRLGLRYFGSLSDTDEQSLRRAMASVSEFRLGRDGGRVEFAGWESQRTGQVGIEGDSGLPYRDVPGGSERPLAASSKDAGTLELELTTPAWLERDGQLDQELSFASLIGSVYRRLSTLCALYGQYGLEDSDRYCGLAENAKLVTITEHRLKPLEWERHSWESNVRHPMKGLVGHVRYASPAAEHLIPFVPILRMAEITHVGKSTSFGLGQIRVTEKLGSRPPAKGPPV